MDGRLLHSVFSVSLALFVFFPAAAFSQDISHGRISYDSGGSMLKGSDDEDWSYAPVNTLVVPDDVLWVDKGDLLEMEMTGGSYLRMADGSKVEVISLPPSVRVNGWAGSFYIQRIRLGRGDFVFDTPLGSIEIEPNSLVRIDIVQEGATTVSVRLGLATLRSGAGGEMVLIQGTRSTLDPGYAPTGPVAFDLSGEDDFDEWNRERSRWVTNGLDSARIYIEEESPPIGFADLEPYGNWVYVDDSYYWNPVIDVDFVPYRVGHWSYLPTYGHVWVGRHPFSYITSHYGRWFHHPHHGWLWSYRRPWGPAWAATIRCGPYFVWSPLDLYNRPVFTGGLYYNFGDFRFSLGASSYSHADLLLGGPSTVYGVNLAIINRVHPRDIHIWDIHAPGQPRTVHTGRRSNMLVRDYTPRRVIRGPDVTDSRLLVARSRVESLEDGLRTGRGSVTRSRGSIREVRASFQPSPRSDSVRTVRLGGVDTPARAPAGRSRGSVRNSNVGLRAAPLVHRSGRNESVRSGSPRDVFGGNRTVRTDSPRTRNSSRIGPVRTPTRTVGRPRVNTSVGTRRSTSLVRRAPRSIARPSTRPVAPRSIQTRRTPRLGTSSFRRPSSPSVRSFQTPSRPTAIGRRSTSSRAIGRPSGRRMTSPRAVSPSRSVQPRSLRRAPSSSSFSRVSPTRSRGSITPRTAISGRRR